MRYQVLSAREVEEFVETGYVLLREAFHRDVAPPILRQVWRGMRLSPDDPSGWTKPVIELEKNYYGPVVDQVFSRRFFGALNDLMGAGRWFHRGNFVGWWTVSFPGFDAPPWHAPTDKWHIEGGHRHRLDSPEIGILPIFLFSDIDPGDGGTALALGSHRIAARELAEAGPDGLPVDELERRVLRRPTGRVIEMNGRAGDIGLLHPFLAHTRSINTGKRVRFICNPTPPLYEPMNLRREDPGEYSPVERAIVEALAAPV